MRNNRRQAGNAPAPKSGQRHSATSRPAGGRKPLYAVAVERGMIAEICYVHAYSAAEARRVYLATDPKRESRIVAIGLSIGYFVDDKLGMQLSL